MARIAAGARLHFGFQNLSLAHERLYGSLGVALDSPRVVVTAESAEGVRADHDRARTYARRAVELLDVPGADVTVERTLPRHVGLGSGTQLALTVLAAVASAHDRAPRVRKRAPKLGRGGRSGVGVAAFESGGFVLDAGHPVERFTADRPARGQWSVPEIAARHAIPDDWRFVVVLPEVEPGRNGDDEDASMRSVVERADPAIADEIATVVTRRVLPAIADGDPERFGAAVAEVGRLNGAWYTDEQGGVYRPPVGELVAELADSPAITGAGQSSWGPAVYGATTQHRADAARDAAHAALSATGIGGEVLVVEPRNRGAEITGSRNGSAFSG
jgi:beta-ribofuranosylaminobenzene 5'-phosphate synthase